MRPAFLLATVLTLSAASISDARADDAVGAAPARIAVHAARMLDVEKRATLPIRSC